ncbi:SAM-dependent methyltransferase [Streptomyces sp. NPDC051020]|uniref:class I SAM-dependent methyltransferase n=1 Tax=Streptomyces sp. NPDC051020 TaxID=3155409 RepID=UPI00343FB4C0
MSETALFAREFLRNPFQTASLIPSSARLVERLVAVVPERGEPVVVELGPGTGPATEAIQRKLAGRGRHIAVELNERLAAHLVRRFPRAEIVTDSAWELPRILAERELRTADVVVSSLPWSAFTGPHGSALVPKIASVLSESGVYTQFTYAWANWASPSRRRLAQLRQAFEEVVTSRTVYRNLPPALVYSARRPRVGAGQFPAPAAANRVAS